MSSPTAEDARLLIQLARWGTALGIEEMLPSLFDESFDPEVADALSDRPVRTMLMFGESLGDARQARPAERTSSSTTGSGSRGSGRAWVRPRIRQRERLGEPRLYENFEALAAGAAPERRASRR